MLDIKFIRENSELVKLGAEKKHIKVDIDELLRLDDKRLEIMKEIESMRAEQNRASELIPIETDNVKKSMLIDSMRKVKEKSDKREEEMKEVMKEWQKLMLCVPNIPDMTVPEGDDDGSNVELKLVGERPAMDFKVKDHIELMENLGMIDLERGSKLAGFRGFVLKGAGARLSFAVLQYAMDLVLKKGYEPMIVPSLVNQSLLYGSGYLPQGEEDLYKTQDDTYLSGTAEVGTMGYYMNEVLDEKDLPKKFVSFSPCFRREAGSHGKDVKGLIRVHEFYKWEQLILCEASHQTSVNFHEEVLANAEELMATLGLHYHVVTNCGGDLGLGQVKKYDIECWMPSQEKFRETHSASYFHDFQTRRLNIRYKNSEGKMHYVHSINNTLAATPRLLACLVENYQNEDGSITIPEVLRPYMQGQEKISKNEEK